MSELLNVLPPNNALDTLLERLDIDIGYETISTIESVNRVTATDVTSPENLPSFARSSMDGYSVKAIDTFGASESLPAYIELVGEVPIGSPPDITISRGQAAKVYTGGMLANGADAVVMLENVQNIDDSTIECLKPVAPGESVIELGEDFSSGDTVITKGHMIRTQDVGGLMGLGIVKVRVVRRPKVAIISTGDELINPTEEMSYGQIRDMNTYTISSLVNKAGGLSIPMGIAPDNYNSQRSLAIKGLSIADILIFSAGSSLSTRDLTSDVISGLGKPGVLVHGIALKPGKPTIIAMINAKPVFGLPGNPVSAMTVFDLLVKPTILNMTGCNSPEQPKSIVAFLKQNIGSQTGREDHVQVRLVTIDGEIWAEPVFGKSNLITTLINSHGVVKVPLNKGGMYRGEEVMVRLH